MDTFSSRDAGAAGELALARLDDDGAPPAVTWPPAGDSHDRDAIRRGRIGQVAASPAQAAAIASGEVAEQTPAGSGWDEPRSSGAGAGAGRYYDGCHGPGGRPGAGRLRRAAGRSGG